MLRHSGKIKELPEYKLRQNVVISVYPKHMPCENHTNVVGIKRLVEGNRGVSGIKRGRNRGSMGQETG